MPHRTLQLTTLICVFIFFHATAQGTIIYYATGNQVKFREAQEFFKQSKIAISLKQYSEDLPEIQSLDQREIQKAKKAWKRLQTPVLVDDAGTFFEKCDTFPGTMTKFVYQALGVEGVCKLFEPGDRAYFQLHLVFYYGPNTYQVFESRANGTLVKPKQLEYKPKTAFYDFFIPDGSSKTCTELIANNAYAPFNFRVKAFDQFTEWYKEQTI